MAAGDTRYVAHWQKEIKTWLEQLAIVLEELEKRGLALP